MTGNTKRMISMNEANRNFSKVVKIANADGSVFIMQDNKPEYILLKINNHEKNETAEDTELDAVSRQLLEQNNEAYRKLANKTKIGRAHV